MDIVYLRKEDQGSINSIDDLKSISISEPIDKSQFKQLIKSQDKDTDDDNWRESFDSFLSKISSKKVVENFSTVVKFNNWRKL